jgi:predicted metal-dependent hydrolase
MSAGDIDFLLVRQDRKTLEIAVDPDGRVTVKAPLDTSSDSIERVVKKRRAWIRRQIDYFSDFEPKLQPRHFVAGEAQLFLGKRYRLRIVSGAPTVAIDGGYLVVASHEKSPARIARAIDVWQRKQARFVFAALLEKRWLALGFSEEKRPRLCIKAMTRRWGSLSAKGALTLNLALIQAPRSCIEYVICHELCHIEYASHGTGFYARLEGMLPDWKERKARLERMLS